MQLFSELKVTYKTKEAQIICFIVQKGDLS